MAHKAKELKEGHLLSLPGKGPLIEVMYSPTWPLALKQRKRGCFRFELASERAHISQQSTRHLVENQFQSHELDLVPERI